MKVVSKPRLQRDLSEYHGTLSGNNISKKTANNNPKQILESKLAGDQQEVILDVSAGTFVGGEFFFGDVVDPMWIWSKLGSYQLEDPGQKNQLSSLYRCLQKKGMDPMFSNNEYLWTMAVHWFMWGFHGKSPFFFGFFISAGGPKQVATNFPLNVWKGKDRWKQASISWRAYVSTLGYVSSGEIPSKKPCTALKTNMAMENPNRNYMHIYSWLEFSIYIVPRLTPIQKGNPKISMVPTHHRH